MTEAGYFQMTAVFISQTSCPWQRKGKKSAAVQIKIPLLKGRGKGKPMDFVVSKPVHTHQNA